MVVVVAVAASCSSSGTSARDSRHPGDAEELLQRIKADGPILVKGPPPYWLVASYDASFHPTPPLVAMYPHIKGYDCILQPIRTHGRYIQFRDPPRCSNGSYDASDLFKYPLRVTEDGSVTVDLSHTVEVNPSG